MKGLNDEMNKHVIVGGVALSATALVLAGCSNPRDTTTSSSGGDDAFRIGLASASYGPYLPVYAAEREGYFKDRGLDVEITAYQGGGAATEALSAGEADLISYNPAGVAVAQAHNIDEVLVGTGMAASTGWYVVVGKDSSAKTLADLDGAKVGIGNPGGTGEFFSLWAEKDADVEWENVALGYGALNENLERGAVDATVQLPPLSYQMPIDGTGRVLADLAEVMDPTIPDGWVASQDLIDSNSEDVQAALEAIYAGVEKLQSDKDYALALIEEKEGISGELAEEEYESTIMSLSTDGAIDPAWIENALSLASDAGLDKDVELPAADEIFTDEFVPVAG